MMNETKAPTLGDYVFATKYDDGDPADGWAVGFYDGILPKVTSPCQPRHMVVDESGNQFRGNGFRKVLIISSEVGQRMIPAAKVFDYPNWSEPGTVNLWDILQDITSHIDEEVNDES